jgi:hypothetical protein
MSSAVQPGDSDTGSWQDHTPLDAGFRVPPSLPSRVMRSSPDRDNETIATREYETIATREYETME